MTKSVKFAGENSVFAQRLKAIMKEKGVTQQQLAEQLHMTRQAVSLYLTGQALPAIDKLLTITDYFDVSADYLIGKTDVRTQDTDVKMICDYTGLSEDAVRELNSRSNSKAYYKAESKKHGEVLPFDDYEYYYGAESNHQIATLNHLLTDDSFYACLCDIDCFSCLLDDAIDRQKIVISAFQSDMTEDNKDFILHSANDIHEMYKQARLEYLSSLELFRDSLSEYREKEKEYLKKKEDITELFIANHINYLE